MSSALWQAAKVHQQLFRAHFLLTGKDSASGNAVDVVGAGHMAPDGAEVRLFTAIASQSPDKTLPPIETNLQTTLNALPIRAWYTRASGTLAFVNQTAAKYLGLPPDHPLRLAGEFEAPWDDHEVFLHPDDRAHSNRNWGKPFDLESPEKRSFVYWGPTESTIGSFRKRNPFGIQRGKSCIGLA